MSKIPFGAGPILGGYHSAVVLNIALIKQGRTLVAWHLPQFGHAYMDTYCRFLTVKDEVICGVPVKSLYTLHHPRTCTMTMLERKFSSHVT